MYITFLFFRYLNLKDATGSINMIFYNYNNRHKLLIGKMVKIEFKRIIMEWSLVFGKSWDLTYIVVDYQDIELIDFETTKKLSEISTLPCIEKHQEWIALYRSHAILKWNKENSSIYYAVRKIIEENSMKDDPQFQFDNDSYNNPIKFLELPIEQVPLATLITAGTKFQIKTQVAEEKYLSILHNHVKRLMKLNPTIKSSR